MSKITKPTEKDFQLEDEDAGSLDLEYKTDEGDDEPLKDPNELKNKSEKPLLRKKREYTEEQRAKMRDRMRAVNAARIEKLKQRTEEVHNLNAEKEKEIAELREKIKNLESQKLTPKQYKEKKEDLEDEIKIVKKETPKLKISKKPVREKKEKESAKKQPKKKVVYESEQETETDSDEESSSSGEEYLSSDDEPPKKAPKKPVSKSKPREKKEKEIPVAKENPSIKPSIRFF